MNSLLQLYPAWNELVRKTWEQAFLRLTQTVLTVQTINAKGRYNHLLSHLDLVQKQPQPQPPQTSQPSQQSSPKDIISIIGIPDPSLSKK
jgi:hypothetical protein